MANLCPLGGATGTSESSHPQESSVHYNIPELQSAPGRPPPSHSFPSLASQPNGQHFPLPPHRDASGTRDDLSAPEGSEEEADEEDDEAPASRWQGIESIFEAYQEYVEGRHRRGTRQEVD